APLCVPRMLFKSGARSWFRANLSAASARRFHQISFPSSRPVFALRATTRQARLRPAGFRLRQGFGGQVDAAAFAHGLPSRSAARREGWWEAEGIEPPAAKGLRLRRSDGTSRPYVRFPEADR